MRAQRPGYDRLSAAWGLETRYIFIMAEQNNVYFLFHTCFCLEEMQRKTTSELYINFGGGCNGYL